MIIQRTSLDILCTYFKLNSDLFSKEENIKIMESLIFLINSNEISVTRRVIQWLLNDNDYVEEFFIKYTKNILILSIKVKIKIFIIF
jgi:hypothetical protein